MGSRETVIKTKATKRQPISLDTVARVRHTLPVPIFTDVVKSMQQRFVYESERMKAARDEMDKLSEAYHRYKDLQDELSNREKRWKRLYALLSPDDLPPCELAAEMFGKIDNPPELGSDVPLWEGLREYLEIVGETRISDAVLMLVRFYGSDVSRQAIESTVIRHPDVFRVRKSGGKKFISLK